MSDQKEIPWAIEEHTKIKHQLLTAYLGVWMPILYAQQALARKEKKLIYVDGFSGPGEYWTDDSKSSKIAGSPILAAEKANTYIDQDSTRKFILIAIDNDKRCVAHLRPLLENLNRHKQDWIVSHQTFEQGMGELFSYLEKENAKLAPAFFFIDPFGYSGFTINTLQRILKHPRTELFINFMHYDINRFIEAGHSQDHLKALFGTDTYKNINGMNSDQKTSFLVDLYCRQLKGSAGASYVLPFRLNTPGQGTRPKYFLVHASQHLKALKEMKNRMAKISSQEFRFEAIGLSAEKQLDLFEVSDENKLTEQIYEVIKSANGKAVGYDQVEDWAYEHTAGVAKNVKESLVSLEQDGRITITRPPRKKKNTVTSGAMIHTAQFSAGVPK